MKSVAERMEEKIDRRGPDECHPWTAATSGGYGVIRIAGKLEKAHRVTFELVNGRPPVGDVLHSCDNPPCNNGAHLADGTHRENMADSWAKGRAGGPPAENAAKTRCGRGHEFTPENTYERPDRPGTRECRACRVENVAAYRERNPEKSRAWDRGQREKARGRSEGG